VLSRWSWTRGLLVVPVALGIAVCGPTAFATPGEDGGVSPGTSSPGDGSQVVTISVSSTSASGGSSSTGGGSWSTTATTTVQPVCYYTPAFTSSVEGHRKAVENPPPPDPLGDEIPSIPWEGWDEHANDTNGWWYTPVCNRMRAESRDEDFGELAKTFYKDNPMRYIWVPEGSQPPAPLIDAQTLVKAAMDAVTIPAPSVETNPKITTGDGVPDATVVGMDTWVWATGDTPSEVRVSASAGSMSAEVVASSSGLRLSAPDAKQSCTGWGSPWVDGESQEGGSDCTIEFTRSSAHLGGTTPVSVSVSYDVSWTASDGSSGTLDPITTNSTIDIPVAEVQTVNRKPDRN